MLWGTFPVSEKWQHLQGKILFPATVYLRMKKLDCYACIINLLCVKSLSNGNVALFSCVGILGSSYGLFMALFAIYKGPKCFVGGDSWEYPFHKGNYLVDLNYWKDCISPPHIIPWHLSIFIVQVLVSSAQLAICICTVMSGLLGSIFTSEKCPWSHKGTDLSKPCDGLFITFYYAHRRSKNASFSSSLENPAAFSSMQQPFWISTQVKNHMFKKEQ
ncbi:transmembrane 4 L6 family member 4-like isoform X3 [Sarcophilus harrisii]|uniref:transmembrane 4 L6 family member 4-like isoform X3 n=1 Tax=Sarcophilus harrisii TaxID=9305 RepID=UPI001301E169|nr:transmembrane 4 L6 family member 4-like isoform X3 [Sarcophilus harrisii]XP_031813648.1 transmembrane 4 L6 family member 4-like isoform X3 [Sarcophilus harrisii]